MKQKLNLWLLAALLCGMSLSVTSCKDDDNSPSAEVDGPEAVTEEMENFNNAAFAVLDELADTDEADSTFLAQTFEPSIGLPDGGDESVRIVNTNSMELAAQRFAQLADADINESTQSYTWSNELMGTMTYQKSQDGKSWATVDVDIRQVPHLRRIIFREPGQADENGAFSGRAYYRFGDVVSREVKNKNGSTIKEYWICVRPAFGLEKKEDSHWVCLNALPDKNIYSWTKKYKKGPKAGTSATWWVPTGLGKNEEHMQNLAEMLYAMLHPAEWEKNVRSKDNPDLKFFHDFSKDGARIDLHNQHFWENVSMEWDRRGLWDKAMNCTRIRLNRQMENANGGLRLLHTGKYWASGMTCKLCEAIYTKGTGNFSNMHSESLIEPKHDMEDITFDCREMGREDKNYIKFFNNDDNMRWCIRHAKGNELVAKGGKYDIRSAIKGVEEVYRYYRDVNRTESGDLINKEPEKTENNPYKYYGAIIPGTILRDDAGTNWLCYSNWADNDTYCTKDHKARFISLNIECREEVNQTGDNKDYSTFFLKDKKELPSLDDAAIAAVVLSYWASTSDEGAAAPISTIREKINETFNINLADFLTVRDSALTIDGKTFPGSLKSINIAYYNGDNDDYTNNYLRLVIDASGLGRKRDELPKEWDYPRLRFFTRYNDKSGRMLNLFDVFEKHAFIHGKEFIPSDPFSRAVRPGTQKGDGNFYVSDLYTESYDPRLFNTNPQKFGTPYREKVIVARYLELDNVSGEVQSTYNGKKYTIVYQPESIFAEPLFANCAGQNYLGRGHNYGGYKNCQMDNKDYELGFFTRYVDWDR